LIIDKHPVLVMVYSLFNQLVICRLSSHRRSSLLTILFQRFRISYKVVPYLAIAKWYSMPLAIRDVFFASLETSSLTVDLPFDLYCIKSS